MRATGLPEMIWRTHLRRKMMRRDPLPGIKTMTVPSGAFDIRQALELKDTIVVGHGLRMVVTRRAMMAGGRTREDVDGVGAGGADLDSGK